MKLPPGMDQEWWTQKPDSKRTTNQGCPEWWWRKNVKTYIRLLYPPQAILPVYGISRIGHNRYVVRPVNVPQTKVEDRVYVNGPLSEAKALAITLARMEWTPGKGE